MKTKISPSLFKYFQKFLESIRSADQIIMIASAIMIGLLAGICSFFVKILIAYISQFFFGALDYQMVSAIQKMNPWVLIFIPAIGGAFVGPIIFFFAKEAKGHGVPEVMEAVVKREGVIRPRVVLVKAIASSLCIGSGGSTGREGPIVQIGASIGSAVGQMLKLSSNRVKTLLACGAAAGIAATFNAPIAGAIFAVEIILGDFGVSQFSPIVISSVMATVISWQLSGGDFPGFNVITDYQLSSLWELIPYAFLGILAAIFAVLFIKVLYKFEDFFEKIPIPSYIKPIIGGLILGVLAAVQFPKILGTGHESIDSVLRYLEGLEYSLEWTWQTMFILAFMKIISTSLTLGSGGSGGVFAPSLFIGAMLGGGFGLFIQEYSFLQVSQDFPIVTMLVSMGALVAASTQAPITAILIIFELTSYSYPILIPLMLASIISTIFAQKLKKESIYTLKLLRRGVNIESGKELNVLKNIFVKDVMRPSTSYIPSQMKLAELLKYVVQSSHSCFIVLDPQKKIVGSFSLHEFKRKLIGFEKIKDILIASDLVQQKKPIMLKEQDNLSYVMNQFGLVDMDELPVLNPKNKFIGMVWKKDVINIYNREILKSQLATGIADRISSIEYIQTAEVIPGYSIIEIPVPKIFVGQTLIQTNLRAKYDVELILIKVNNPNQKEIFPHGKYQFQNQDRLLLFGNNSKIRLIQNL